MKHSLVSLFCRASRNFSPTIFQTYSQHNVPIGIQETLRVPISVVDKHLRDVQLPFCYFFGEELDEVDLLDSFRKVILYFPILGGRLRATQIECHPEDFVSICFGKCDQSLSYWLKQSQKFTTGTGHQAILPLFDPLFPPGPQKTVPCDGPLATVRITYFKGGGTSIGINMNHALADAASCFRFMQCWGREMRNKSYPRGASNNRASATCSGMLTNDIAELMGDGSIEPNTSLIFNHLVAFYDGIADVMRTTDEDVPVTLPLSIKHEYIGLEFSPEDLAIIKAHGMNQCSQSSDIEYISTNDMITAFGWLLKRHLSGNNDWNISMVIDLRGQGGIDAFTDMKNGSGLIKGVFGNAITHVSASLPPTDYQEIDLDEVGLAAFAIRQALLTHVVEVSDRVAHSRFGKPQPTKSIGPTFSTTSWGKFPLWEVGFVPGVKLTGFYGCQTNPLPKGETFSSIIIPRQDDGCTLKILLPSSKLSVAKLWYKQLLDSVSKFAREN